MNPVFDWHALAPDIVLVGDDRSWCSSPASSFPTATPGRSSRIAAIGVLVALIPIVTLAVDGADRSMFGGAYVVDNYALALKAFFIVATYITILVSVDYIESKATTTRASSTSCCSSSTLGLSVMASAARPHHDLRRPRD